MRKVNYDRFPSTKITGTILQGWDAVHTLLVECFKVKKVVAVDFYAGVREEEVAGELELLSPTLFINTRNLMKPQDEIKAMTERFMTDDVLFGYVTNLTLNDYFDAEKLEQVELLPYHVTAGAKYEMVGRSYQPEFDTAAAPNLNTEIFRRYGLKCTHL